MRRTGWGIALGANTDGTYVLLGGRYAVPASARAFVNALTTYSPPPRKR